MHTHSLLLVLPLRTSGVVKYVENESYGFFLLNGTLKEPGHWLKQAGGHFSSSDLQLSSCIVHVWTSIGKFFKSMGQDKVKVSLSRENKILKQVFNF